jgi:hypothetical protein
MQITECLKIMYNLEESSEFIETSAPISQEILTDYFSKEQQDITSAIILDYETSSLKGKQLLIYLSNLDVRSDIKISNKLPLRDRFELIFYYMALPNIVECPSLAITVASILALAKGFTEVFEAVENPILSLEESAKFINDYFGLVSNWLILMDSMVLYTLTINKKYVEKFGDPTINYEAISDAEIGKNFVNLFAIAPFMEFYYSVPSNKMYYFTRQFEDNNYKHKTLYSYFMVRSNPLPVFVESMITADYDINKAETELKEFLNAKIKNNV